MGKTLGERADGQSFRADPLTGEELARLRHMLHILNAEFLTPEDMVDLIPREKLAAHLGIGLLSGVSIFIRKYKTGVLAIIAGLSVLNYEVLFQIAGLLSGLIK